jgi:hypothetical protein
MGGCVVGKVAGGEWSIACVDGGGGLWARGPAR